MRSTLQSIFLTIFYLFLGINISYSYDSDIHAQTLKSENKLIKLDSYFPDDNQVEQGIYLKHTGPLCVDNQNNIYMGDWDYCTFHKFNEKGQLLFSFGKKGRGPHEQMQVHHIAPFHNGLLLMDSGNRRIQVLDENGKYQNSFKIFKSYHSMAVSNEDLIYVSPKNPKDFLIDVLDTTGHLLASFGEKIKTKKEHIAFNKVILGLNSKKEVWAAWYYFPYIIRYSQDGKIIKKYTLNDDAIKNIVKMNEKQRKSPKITNSVRLMSILNCFYLTESRFYLFLIGDAKPRIVEYDYQGQERIVYEIYDDTEKIIYENMVVLEHGEEDRIFYMVQAFPEARIDVYKVNPEK